MGSSILTCNVSYHTVLYQKSGEKYALFLSFSPTSRKKQSNNQISTSDGEAKQQPDEQKRPAEEDKEKEDIKRHPDSKQISRQQPSMQVSAANASASRHAPDGQPSPANSASATPTNNSPSSPGPMSAQPQLPHQPLQGQSRQLRPLKTPLYVPAALRRTERPPKPSPLTPPRSVHGSVDGQDGQDDSITPTENLSRRSTVDSTRSGVSRLAQDEWLRDQNLGEVTGSPTREHWKVDSPPPLFISTYVP